MPYLQLKAVRLLVIYLVSLYLVSWCKPCHAGNPGETVPMIVYHVIAAESAGESDAGMRLVAQVIVNRARMRGLTLEQVVRQKYQFSALNDKKWLQNWSRKHFDSKTGNRAYKAMKAALESKNRTGLTHYHTLTTHPKWARGHCASIREGNHVFYEGIQL